VGKIKVGIELQTATGDFFHSYEAGRSIAHSTKDDLLTPPVGPRNGR